MVAAAGGKRWKRDKEPHIAGDASDHAYAAYIPNGEYEHAVLISFTPLVAQNKYSSTLRELTCILWTVKVRLEHAPYSTYAQLLRDPILAGRIPAIDIFASSTNTKVKDSVYSKFLCPGTKGVDAMVHPCSLHDQQGNRMLAFINGPFHLMGRIIRKIKDEQADCILTGPAWSKHWVAMLHTLPVNNTHYQ
ncbi:hypothetical protein WJX77_003788 [Trebouxia sp. C0004]